MNLTPIPSPIIQKGDDLFSLLTQQIKTLGLNISEYSVFVVSSKVVALSQRRVSTTPLREEVENQADEILVDKGSFFLTVNDGIVIANAGIDESNSKKGEIILWPENTQEYVDVLRKQLQDQYNIENIGVIISDSRVTMRRRGTVGVALAWSGIWGVKDERGKKDLFGRTLEVSTVNIADNLVSAAEVLMGQADEATPFVCIQHLSPELFTNTQQSPENAFISKEEDLFSIS